MTSGPTLSREWFSTAELAASALPMLPHTKRGVQEMADRARWSRPEWKDQRWRERQGRGGGIEFHYSLLPSVAQIKLTLDLTQVEEANERETGKRELTRAEMWSWYDSLPTHKKTEAKRRLEALDAIQVLTRSGIGKVLVSQRVATQFEVSLATLYGWQKAVHGQDRHDWLPYLAPRQAGRSDGVECDPDAWQYLKDDWLRLSRPTFEACHRRLRRVAKERGWTIPSARTLRRRLDALPEGLRVLAREGTEALKRMYPAQQRDRGAFHALEAVNADGHKWDVFVKWPDGYVGRPVMVAFQDLYSGMILSWRVDRSENKEAVRLAFGDMVEAYGIPDHCWLDNGRNFASKWLTGGTPTRYRFKIKDDEPDGVMTQLGVQVHWTTPYAGQSKPIERAFRDLAGDVAKHPAFEGAYTGNSPMAKPENYGNTAVPLDLFLQTIGTEIAEHNTREGRRSDVARGRAFQAVFEESYAKSPIRKATAEQRRLWLLAAEAVSTAKVDGSIEIMGNRYWAEFLGNHRQQKLAIRFDPQALHADLHVYRLDGAYLGAAPCVAAVGFADAEAAREHARARGSHRKATRALLDAERKMTPAQLAALLPEADAPTPPPETKVVRLISGANALRPAAAPEPDDDRREATFFAAIQKANAARAGGAQLRLVNPDPNPDDDV
jgi:transposase InsO family protein